MLELVLGLLLAAGAVFFVLRPVLRPETAFAAGREDAGGDAGADPDDDLSPRAVALRALKEIEFDRATGKLSDGDYEALRAKYTAEALAALRGGEPGAGSGSTLPPAATAPGAPLPGRVCPVDGPRPEAGAVFCSACGRRLEAAAAGYCGRCGGALETDARYCGRCGVPVAA